MPLLTRLLTLVPALFCSLGDNQLGEVGGTAVAEAVEVNTSLKELK